MTAILDRLGVALGDRYRVERELGAGGMATVYLAEDRRHDRQVALKVLRPEFALHLGPERFLSEIRTTARLQHPHILPLYDSGAAEGLFYYVMPLVEGESLRVKMDREGKLSFDSAIHLASEVADALAYAHAHDVIHRDIKPENILLADGHALVADFGIARAVNAAGNRLTQTGLAIGTPAYMSPEQAAGDTEVDGRSDEYSLACMLFEMLAGELPFSGANAAAILVQRFTQHPPRLSSKRAGAPVSIEAAIQRAMARDPADRYPGVAQFAEALTAPASAAVNPADKSIAVLPFSNVTHDPEDEYFSDGITEEIINALAQLDGLRVAARTSCFACKGSHEDLRTIAGRLGVSTVLEGSIRKFGSRLRVTAQLINASSGYHLWSERYDREITDVFAIQDEIANAIASKLRVALAGSVAGQLVRPGTGNLQAYELFLKGRVLQTRRGPSLQAALECFHKAVALDPNFAEAHAWLADSYRALAVYGFRSATETMPVAKIAAERAVELETDLAEAHATLADVALLYDRDPVRAVEAWERALTRNPSHIRARCERALWWFTLHRGDFARAVSEVRHATDLDPLNPWAAGMAALVLGLGGRMEEAETESRRAVELDPDAFLGRWLLVEVAMWTGAYDRAIAAAAPALLMGRHPWVLASLGLAYAGAGNKAAAEAVYAELQARAGMGFVQPFWLATAALATDRRDEAVAMVERSVAEHDPIVGWLKRLPEWAPLRTDPRIERLLVRLGMAD